MVPKTERFEMRLDPVLIERIDDWSRQQKDEPSRAEAIRRLIEDGLVTKKSAGRFDPSGTEKLMLWMLGEILKQNKKYENARDVDLIQEVIYGGHNWALEWEMVGIFHDHVDRRSALNLVVDTLDMWDFIEAAAGRLTDADNDRLEKEVGIWARSPEFTGFDGNNEGEYRSIATFLVNKLGRFERFKGRSLNSHSPKGSSYRAMLREFEPIRSGLVGKGLSVDELIRIMKNS